MAIVFISPKKKQKVFFRIIMALLILLLFIVSLIIFPPQFKSEPQGAPVVRVFETPDVKINFDVLDSDQVKNLRPFGGIETEFTYLAQDENGNPVIGKTSAVSKDAAEEKLAQMGIASYSLEEITTGRNNPFVPYY